MLTILNIYIFDLYHELICQIYLKEKKNNINNISLMATNLIKASIDQLLTCSFLMFLI
jgi:hypothetical protein